MEKFVLKNNLRPADRLVVPKSGWRLIQHHAIYWGVDQNGVHWVLENKENVGVRAIRLSDFLKDCIEITRIDYFKGKEYQRRNAIHRAEKLIGKPYQLWEFNCENYANYVQLGKAFSKQVENVADGLKVVAGVGLFFLTLNLIAKTK